MGFGAQDTRGFGTMHPKSAWSKPEQSLPGEAMTAVSAPPCEDPDGFRHLQDLVAYLNGHWRYRPENAPKGNL